MDQQKQSADFMAAAGQEVLSSPVQTPENKTKNLRFLLVLEELLELADALGIEIKHKLTDTIINQNNFQDSLEINITDKFDVVETADALTDLLYVIYGAGNAFGINLDATYNEVHRSNMSKFIDGHRHPVSGKWIKGPSYSPANLKSIVLGE